MPREDCCQAESECVHCGRRFRCGSLAGDETCWCSQLPLDMPVPAAGTAGCYCRDCLAEALAVAVR